MTTDSILLDQPGHVMAHEDAAEYILSGNATCTFENTKTGNHFSYTVQQAPESGTEHKPAIWFVKALLGPDRIPQYIGYIKVTGYVYGGGKARVSADAQCNQVFDYVWRKLTDGTLPECIEIWHEGRCGRCGRQLTDPVSIATGIGPVCRTKLVAC